MNQKELFEARVHAVACGYAVADTERLTRFEVFASDAVNLVQEVDRILSEALHADGSAHAGRTAFGYTTTIAGAELRSGDLVTVYPAAPLAYRPMSEFDAAKGDVVVAFLNRRELTEAGYPEIQSAVFNAESYREVALDDTDLGWFQLPPLPTVKL